ncbi:MAG: acetate--CoA ligase family protein [Minisyncoccota bacterium]
MSLEHLFSPRSIAVIGASTTSGSVGHTLTANLLANGYAGTLFLVNPKTDTLFDRPCYPNISAIPETADLAIIIVPALLVITVLQESAQKGIKNIIIISAGFKESDEAGKRRELEIIAIAKEYDLTILGPNCLGFLRPTIGLNASFAPRLPKKGEIAFFSQSGALCTALLDICDQNIGFSHFISTGNKAVVDENTLLSFLAQDNTIKLLGFYSEGIENSTRFIETGRALLTRVTPLPVIVLKSGTTSAGTQASRSHTGALAGSDIAYEALFKQARMIRAKSLEHLLNFLTVFSKNNLPKGNRIGIVTNAGGLGVLAVDNASFHGLEMAVFAPETEAKLQGLPVSANIHNPVDVLGDALADRYRLAIDTLIDAEEVDMLLIIVTPQKMTQAKETAQAIVDAKQHSNKPLVAVFSGATSLSEGIDLLQHHQVATLTYPEAGAEALAGLAKIQTWRHNDFRTPFIFDHIDTQTVREIIDSARQHNQTTLSPTQVSAILRAYGFPVIQEKLVTSAEEALAVTKHFAVPTVFKIVSPDIIHKSDVGGVILDVSPESGADTYQKLMTQVATNAPTASITGILIAEMISADSGQEIILGLKKEPGLGTLVLTGLGGIFVETFQDIAMRFAPLTQEDAQEMLTELRSYPLFTGVRGQTGIHIATLVNLIGRLSQLAIDFPEIVELDINPVLAFAETEKFRVIDARIVLSS